MRIVYSKKFISEYKKLPQQIKPLAEKKEKIFKKDAFEPSLKTHRLTGRLITSGHFDLAGFGDYLLGNISRNFFIM